MDFPSYFIIIEIILIGKHYRIFEITLKKTIITKKDRKKILIIIQQL